MAIFDVLPLIRPSQYKAMTESNRPVRSHQKTARGRRMGLKQTATPSLLPNRMPIIQPVRTRPATSDFAIYVV
jgi:hypothetical protein